MDTVQKYIEAAAVLVLVYLVVTHAFGFSQALGAIGGLNVGAIKALQGRG